MNNRKHDEMDDLINRLYEAFRPYRLGTTIEGCNHCAPARDSDALLKTPLRELTSRQLSQFSLKAMTTWGTGQDFKHFLPRLLELAYIDPLDLDWLETMFGKLEMARWREWPANERQVISAYLSELWTAILARPRRYDCDESADSVLCAIGRTGVEIQPFLEQWIQDKSQSALEHLCVFVDSNFESMRKSSPQLANSFWEIGSQAETSLIGWLQSSIVKERIDLDEARIADDLRDVVWKIALIAKTRPETTA